jgi:hypothetical protein
MYTAQVQVVAPLVAVAPHPPMVTLDRTIEVPFDGLYVMAAEGSTPL